MDDTRSAYMTIRCQCGSKLKMPAAATGKKAKCPKCQQVFVVPKPRPAPPLPSVDEPGDSDSLLDELANQAGSAPARESARGTASNIRCPKCSAEMPATAVLCVACGYDTRTGKSHKKASVAAAVISKLAAASGTFMLGCFLSGVGALVGALVWAGIAIGTGYEIGWVAWAVGALAGFGMLMGCGDASIRSGIVAACIALVGVVVSKIFIFAFIAYAVVTGNTGNIELQRAYVAAAITEEKLDELEVTSPAERRTKGDQLYDRAYARLAKMDDKAVQAQWNYYRAAAAMAVRQSECNQIAGYRSSVSAQAVGLSYIDPRAGELHKQEYDRLMEMDQEALDAEVAAFRVWLEVDRWHDEAYVRNSLVYERIDTLIWAPGNAEEVAEGGGASPKAVAVAETDTVAGRPRTARVFDTAPDSEEADDAADADEAYDRIADHWDDLYANAVATVDAMSPEERLVELQRIEAESEEPDEFDAGETDKGSFGDDDGEIDTEDAVTTFFTAAFSPLDILFVLLAVSSAYKIGTGSGR